MIDVQKALVAKAKADATLIAAPLLDGQHIYFRRPEIDTNALNAWVTFGCVSRDVDTELGLANEVWQFDIWARTSDLGEAVAERISVVFGWHQSTGGGTLPALTTRRLAEPIYEEAAAPDIPEDAGDDVIHHKVRQFRVATYPA